MKYKKTSKKLLLVLFTALVLISFRGATASASVPPDNSKNYIYTKDGSDCAAGDFGVLNDPTECIRIRSDGKGYTITKPVTSSVTGKALACGQNSLGVGVSGGGGSTIFELISGPFVDGAHHACLTVTDPTYGNDPGSDTPSKFWDIFTYSDRTPTNTSAPINTGDYYGTYTCGGGKGAVHISINLGCRHKGNPILDMLFAVIRFLSIGVGFVIVGSLIVAGIQYTTSRGDPQATAKALGRVANTVGALLLFIFAYAILNWLIPGALLK